MAWSFFAAGTVTAPANTTVMRKMTTENERISDTRIIAS